MSRKLARELAMKLLFQMDVQGDYSKEMLGRYIEELPEDAQQNTYITDVIQKYIENKDKIDFVIEENSKEWKLNRMAKVDVAILRVAVAEILYREDIPASVSINEAVELGKNFSTDESGSFINGILGSIVEKN